MLNFKFVSQPFAKLLVLCRLRPFYRLIRFNARYRLIIRNHWSNNYNDEFLIVADSKWQGHDLKVYRFGLMNFSLCLMCNREDE